MLPTEATYAGRMFELSVRLPQSYPFPPPAVAFVTPTYHYAVSTSGSLCLYILRDTWTPNTMIWDVLETVRRLVTDPTADMSLRVWLSELFQVDRDEYMSNAEADAIAHANTAPTNTQGPGQLQQTRADALLRNLLKKTSDCS